MEYPSYGTPPAGSIRFNTDSSKMEIYNGDKWWNIDSTSPAEQTGGTRGLWGGGNTPTYFNNIQYVNISTTGNTVDFGDLNRMGNAMEAVSSRTRALYGGTFRPAGGGSSGSPYTADNVIDYVTITSTGNATDFGDLTVARSSTAPMQNSTRGLWGGGYRQDPAATYYDTIDYVTMASTGNAVDFGNFAQTQAYGLSGCSPTRGVVGRGGIGPAGASTNNIEYITFSTTGNTSDFGDTTTADTGPQGTSSNAVRAVFWTSSYAPNTTDIIDYIMIATLGNAKDFGDLNHISMNGASACASSTRSVSGGGYDGGIQEELDYVQIMTTGNAVDFGNLHEARSQPGACSNGHGGLG
jgi:hypothetical protein